MKVNIRQLKKWIAALDSGEYGQAHGELQKPGNRFCCIGVGCIVTIPAKKLYLNSSGRLIGAFADAQPNAPDWLQKINLDFNKKTGRSLVQLNDLDGYTFSEIATLLELVYIHKILD